MKNKEIAVAAAQAIFERFDAKAAEELLAPDYIQHNPAVPTGAAPILGFIPALKESGITTTMHRVIAEGDLVVMHGVYRNAQLFGGDVLVAFDVFRIDGQGRVAEHWDNLQPWAENTVSGNSMVDGETEIADVLLTAANKATVQSFVNDVLHGAAPDRIADYISTETYIQHNPLVGNGLDGLVDALVSFDAAGQSMQYKRSPLIVAEGNFVFVGSEGLIGTVPTAFFDLFRLSGGKIVEHWDTVAPIPSEMAHENGKF